MLNAGGSCKLGTSVINEGETNRYNSDLLGMTAYVAWVLASASYQNPWHLIHWLIDTVSKNGTFILNIPGRPNVAIDSREIAVLDRITDWIEVNGEAIYGTRPLKALGEGPESLLSS